MKKIYSLNLLHTIAHRGISMAFVLPVLMIQFNTVRSQVTTYSFLTCGGTGQSGPSQAQANSAYALTNLNGSVVVTGGIQTWTVPTTGLYRFVAAGSAGGGNINNFGCRGRIVQGEMNLTAGQVLKILVGQKGVTGSTSTGGGGGSYVATITNTPIIIGGGGAGYCSVLGSAMATTDGQYGNNGATSTDNGGAGGTNGNGGSGHNGHWGGGGGGWFTNGTQAASCPGTGGSSFLNGGMGGGTCNNSVGGFGGGGGTHGNTGGGGGGGGYSGGGGSGQTPSTAAGGGGGSYQMPGMTNLADLGFNTGEGYVNITRLCYINVNSVANPICAGNTTTLSTDAVSNYSWSTGSTASSIVVTPAVSTSYTIVATSSMNCVASAVIDITVSAGLPVLAITSSTDNLCLGKTATLTASGALSYTWTNGVTNGASFTPSVTNTYTVTGQNGCGTTSAVTTITVAPLPVTIQNTPTLACAGLPTTLIASSGVNGYTWQPVPLFGATIVVNPTVNTVYTVTASDGTCSGVATLSLNTLPVPTIGVVASTSVTCAGFPVTMSASGGLTYTWLPGNLSGATVTVYPTGPTLYTVNGVNSVGCVTGTTQIMLTDPSPVVNVSGSPTLSCAGTLVSLNASGTAAGYMWTGGPSTPGYQVNPNSTTIYSVTGTSSTNTCTTTKTIQITVFNPVVSINANTTTVCSGADVVLTATGADEYSWLHNSSSSNVITDNPQTTTVYNVSAMSQTINGLSCPSTASIQINVNPNPTVTASSSRTLICKDESTDLNASGAQNYVWSNTQTAANITVAPVGITIHTYSLTGTDANGCKNQTTILIRVIGCNGIAENGSGAMSIKVYPNPSSGEITLNSDSDAELSIINALGQEITTVKLDRNSGFKSEVKGLAAGVYFIQVKGNRELTQKIVVQ